MKSNIKALLAAAGVAAFAFSPANAFEGGVAWQQKPGAFIGSSAGVPPPGIYMFDQVFTYQSNLAGPLTNVVGTQATSSKTAAKFLFNFRRQLHGLNHHGRSLRRLRTKTGPNINVSVH